jgi:hypothetical protein
MPGSALFALPSHYFRIRPPPYFYSPIIFAFLDQCDVESLPDPVDIHSYPFTPGFRFHLEFHLVGLLTDPVDLHSCPFPRGFLFHIGFHFVGLLTIGCFDS